MDVRHVHPDCFTNYSVASQDRELNGRFPPQSSSMVEQTGVHGISQIADALTHTLPSMFSIVPLTSYFLLSRCVMELLSFRCFLVRSFSGGSEFSSEISLSAIWARIMYIAFALMGRKYVKLRDEGSGGVVVASPGS